MALTRRNLTRVHHSCKFENAMFALLLVRRVGVACPLYYMNRLENDTISPISFLICTIVTEGYGSS